MSRRQRLPILRCDEGDDVQLPHKWQICTHCDGEGKSSAYLGAFTAEDMAEAGPEFVEDYVGGFYDRACDECGGSGKVAVPDYSKISKDDAQAYREQCASDFEHDRMSYLERAFGA